jgi:L-ascorbate metabolism protein UlaG (beta-lactamase superfamily)
MTGGIRPPSDSVTFLGTATVLLRLGPFTLLTDPNFLHRGQWVHIGHGLVTRRRTEPAAQWSQLPQPDAVLLSHLHGDHFDRVAGGGRAPPHHAVPTPPPRPPRARGAGSPTHRRET